MALNNEKLRNSTANLMLIFIYSMPYPCLHHFTWDWVVTKVDKGFDIESGSSWNRRFWDRIEIG